jgi:predicted transcriptional regulator
LDLLAERILAILAAGPKTRTALRDQLGVRNERLGEVLSALGTSGRIVRRGGLLGVPVPAP